MKNHIGAIVAVVMFISAGLVYGTTMQTGIFRGSLGTPTSGNVTSIPNSGTPSNTQGAPPSSTSTVTPEQNCSNVCGAQGLCCDKLLGGGFPTCKQCPPSSQSQNCDQVCGAQGLCCDKLLGGGFPTCKQCGISSSKSFSSQKSTKSSMVSCSSVTNTKAAWGNSAVHTYTDASGQKGRGDAYANAQNDAQTQAKGACAGLTVGPCNAGCGTVSVSGPTFAPAQEGAQCGEQLVSIGVHAVTCRVTGTCTMTRACSVNL